MRSNIGIGGAKGPLFLLPPVRYILGRGSYFNKVMSAKEKSKPRRGVPLPQTEAVTILLPREAVPENGPTLDTPHDAAEGKEP